MALYIVLPPPPPSSANTARARIDFKKFQLRSRVSTPRYLSLTLSASYAAGNRKKGERGRIKIRRRSHMSAVSFSILLLRAFRKKPVLYLMAWTAASRCTWAASQTCWSHSERLSVIPSRSAALWLAGPSPVAATFPPRSAARSSWLVQSSRSRLRPSQLKNRILSGGVVSWEHVCNRWECFTWIFYTDFRGFCHCWRSLGDFFCSI